MAGLLVRKKQFMSARTSRLRHRQRRGGACKGFGSPTEVDPVLPEPTYPPSRPNRPPSRFLCTPLPLGSSCFPLHSLRTRECPLGYNRPSNPTTDPKP